MTGIAVHALHYGLLGAGLVTVAALIWNLWRGRRDEHDEHDERVRRLRASLRSTPPPDEGPGDGLPPSA